MVGQMEGLVPVWTQFLFAVPMGAHGRVWAHCAGVGAGWGRRDATDNALRSFTAPSRRREGCHGVQRLG